MWAKQLYYKIKIFKDRILYRKESRPKIPRKKLEIQLEKMQAQLKDQLDQLDHLLSYRELSPTLKMIGTYLQKDISRFFELYIVRINMSRLQRLPVSFVHPVDFSNWILQQMQAYSEDVFYFISLCEEGL